MEIKTKYSIGQTIGFNPTENKVAIATITDIDIYVDKKGMKVYYNTDYPTMDMNYGEPYGEPYMSTIRVEEDKIIGIAEVTFV